MKFLHCIVAAACLANWVSSPAWAAEEAEPSEANEATFNRALVSLPKSPIAPFNLQLLARIRGRLEAGDASEDGKTKTQATEYRDYVDPAN